MLQNLFSMNSIAFYLAITVIERTSEIGETFLHNQKENFTPQYSKGTLLNQKYDLQLIRMFCHESPMRYVDIKLMMDFYKSWNIS